LEGLGDGVTNPRLKKVVAGYEAEHTVPDLGRFIRSLRNRMWKRGRDLGLDYSGSG
jgi:hypothetical protein